MFDTNKIQRMTALLQKMPTEFDNVYIVHEGLFLTEAAALFRRLKIPVQAIMDDTQAGKISLGLPIISTAQASANFNGRTALIILTRKPVPFIQTTFDFRVAGGTWTLPALVMAPDEILAVYDRLTILEILRQYQEDGLPLPPPFVLAEATIRGLTTFLNPEFEDIKFRYWNRKHFVLPKYYIDDTAIVLRGQIVYENHYTEKTFEFYRSIYPKVPIVVSTWKNEITNSFREACEKNSVILLENIQPKVHSWRHVNLQIENAFRGIDYVKRFFDTKFALVTRTDQRLNKFDFLLHFKNLILQFPPFGNKTQGRILTLGSYLASRYTPFHITDFLAFGFTSDIFKFYDMPQRDGLDEFQYFSTHRKFFSVARQKLMQASYMKCNFLRHPKRLKKFNVVMDHFVITDIFWMKNFYRKYIAPLDKTKLLETWWQFMREYLLFVGIDSVVFDWPKYEHQRYEMISNGTDFAQWLDMYRNFKIDWV